MFSFSSVFTVPTIRAHNTLSPETTHALGAPADSNKLEHMQPEEMAALYAGRPAGVITRHDSAPFARLPFCCPERPPHPNCPTKESTPPEP